MQSKSSTCSLRAAPLVEPGGEADIPTDFGPFHMVGYRDAQGREHLAVIRGALAAEGVLCRVHSECLTGEVFHSRRCDCRPQLQLALQRIARAGSGLVVYLRQEGRGIGLVEKLRAYALQDQGHDTLDANLALGYPADMRRYDVAAAILDHLGVRSVRLMTNNPDKVRGLRAAGIRVVQRVGHETGITDDNAGYLKTKQERMGHLLHVPRQPGT